MQLITPLLVLLSASLSLAAPSTPALALVSRVPTPAEQAVYLNSHNTNRAQHGAAPLTWDASLASAAQTWANGCKFAHSGGAVGPYGENLAAGTGTFGAEEAVQAWTDEASSYDPSNPQPSHWTQVVWKGTTNLGCAEVDCTGIFPPEYGTAHYHVCEYSPPGNVIGQFPANVQK